LPSIGIYLMVVWGACDLGLRWKHGRAVLGGAAAAVLLAGLVLCSRQASYWKDSESLFKQCIRASGGDPDRPGEIRRAHGPGLDDNYYGYNHLGKEYDRKGVLEGQAEQTARVTGKTAEAAEHHRKMKELQDAATRQFEASILINPNYDFGNNNLGVCYARHQTDADDEKAEHCFKEALRINPSYADACNNLCVLMGRHKRFAEAAVFGERAISIRGDRASDHVNLAIAYEGLERTEDARREYLAAIHFNPTFSPAYHQLGQLYARENDLAKAAACFEVLTKIEPDRVDSHWPLAYVYACRGRAAQEQQQPREADEFFAKAAEECNVVLRISPQNPQALQLLQEIESRRK
jgi:tetratricopeptide (TPR) repeat protein